MAALQAIRVRPALWAAAALIGGIASYRILPSYPALWIALCLAAIAGAALLHRMGRATASSGSIALAIAFAGVAATQMRAFAFPADHIAKYTSNEPRLACIKLRIAEPPRTVESARSWMMPARQVCHCQAIAIRTVAGWRSATGTVELSLAQVMPNLSAGDTVLAVGLLGRPAGPMNPGQFDEAEQLRQRGILAELDVHHDSAVQVLSTGRGPILPALRNRAEALLGSGFVGDRAIDGALLQALVLGRRPSSLHPVEDDFSSAGVMHLLASNGARIAVLAAFVYLLGRMLGLHPRLLICTAAGSAILYGCLTSAAPQTIRPVLLCAAVGVAFAGRRWVDSVQLLACAAIALLVAQPMDLFAAGFQLSFVTVLALMLLSGPARRVWLAMEDPDERVLASFGRLSPIRVGWQSVRRKMMALAAMAVIAWAAAMPLVAYHFQQINPYSVPMGLALSPLVFVCLAAGAMKILFTAAVPGLASAWSAMAGMPTDALRHAVHAAAKLPGSDLPIATPSAGWLIVWYAALAACALPNRAGTTGRAGRRRWLSTAARMASPAMGAILLIGPMTGMSTAPPQGRPLRITLLAIGAGQCAVVETPDGKATLIDAGSTSMSQMMREVLEPFLRYEARRRVARLVLSNNAADRVSAADDVVVDCGKPAVFTSAAVGRSVG
ncbi:MAG TPA: ComEC family competence protein, partial [Tepidisphaeraceae bacterium]|nr:ComEC family competence protein [Tepidisphaeraceae bacterium]